ncbi:hypothetical protein [Lysobacter sp. P5_B9]
MPKFLKGLLAGLGKALLALVLVFGLFVGYAAFSERSASGKAEDFCRTTVPGSATAALLDSAISHGADTVHTKWYQSDGQDQLPVTFSGATPLSRHICWVKAAQGRVVSSRVVYLD